MISVLGPEGDAQGKGSQESGCTAPAHCSAIAAGSGRHNTARMPTAHLLALILTVLFALGVAGCAIVIPLAAWKFFSVLLEKDTAEDRRSRYVELQ